MTDWRLLPGSTTAHLWRERRVGIISLCSRVRDYAVEDRTVSEAAVRGCKRCKSCQRAQSQPLEAMA